MVGKVSFDDNKLVENITYVVAQIVKAKPQTVKGKYIQNISLSSTMGPGIHVDLNSIDM
jgi:large subunit ribosomal protein L1